MTKRTKILAEIGKDIGRGLARAGRSTAEGLAQIVCKSSYPILGNLSGNLQTRIQNLVTERYYDACDATAISIAVNGISTLVYSYITTSPKDICEHPLLYCFAFPVTGAGIIAMDMATRSQLGWEGNKNPTGSLPGNIVSLPFNGLTYVYDAWKKYLKDVVQRAEIRK